MSRSPLSPTASKRLKEMYALRCYSKIESPIPRRGKPNRLIYPTSEQEDKENVAVRRKTGKTRLNDDKIQDNKRKINDKNDNDANNLVKDDAGELEFGLTNAGNCFPKSEILQVSAHFVASPLTLFFRCLKITPSLTQS